MERPAIVEAIFGGPAIEGAELVTSMKALMELTAYIESLERDAARVDYLDKLWGLKGLLRSAIDAALSQQKGLAAAEGFEDSDSA
jgi:hypothetical protein